MNWSTAPSWKHRLRRLALLSLPALVVGTASLVIVLRLSGGHRAQADFPHAGLNFSVSAGVGSEQCDSHSTGGLPAKCTFDTGATFRLNFRLNALPNDFAYSGYDTAVRYTAGLAADGSSLTQQGPGTWTACVYPIPFVDPDNHRVAPGCAVGLPTTPTTLPTSTYTGVMWYINFTCGTSPSIETITLTNGDGQTDVTDVNSIAHGEATDESITINCGAGGATPTPSNTPGPTTPTPTRTATRTPTRTSTRTPTPSACARLGDVNADGHTNSLDALSILQFDAHLLMHVPHPECGDLNHDGMINSIDALFVLQIDAGLLSQP